MDRVSDTEPVRLSRSLFNGKKNTAMETARSCRVLLFAMADERGLTVIHQFRNNGYNIVLDVNSGSVHVVDDVVYDAVALMEKNMPEDEILSRAISESAKKTCGKRWRSAGH